MQSIRNHFRDVYGILLRHKFHNLINIIGLSIGFALTLFIFLFVRYELSYDRQNIDSERLFRLYSLGMLGNDSIRTAASPIPSIKIFSEIDSLVETFTQVIPGSNKLVTYQDKSFAEKHFFYSDTSFFQVFKVNFLSGYKATALCDSFSVVISQTVAQKYFNHENPMGKTLSLDNGLNLKVTGVFEDAEKASHFRYDFIASINSIDKLFENDRNGLLLWKNNWLMLNAYNYLRLRKGIDPLLVEREFNQIKDKLMTQQLSSVFTESEMSQKLAKVDFALQPVTKIHLHSNLSNELERNSDMVYISFSIVLMLLILLTSVFSFANLSNSRIDELIDEYRSRRLFGGGFKELVSGQIMVVVVQSIISLFFGVVLLELLFPFLNDYLSLGIHISEIRSMYDLLEGLIVVIIIVIVIGAVPGLYLSKRCKIIDAECHQTDFKWQVIIRGGLVIFQLVVTIILIVFSISIKQQLQGVKSFDLGYNPKNLIAIERGYVIGHDLDNFKKDLKKNNSILNISACSYLPGDETGQLTTRISESDNQLFLCDVNFVDTDYIATMQIATLVDNHDGSTDSIAVTINEKAAKEFGNSDLYIKNLELVGASKDESKKLAVKSIVKDFYFNNMKTDLRPMALFPLTGSHFQYIVVRYQEGQLEEAKMSISHNWIKYAKNQPLDLFLLKDRVDEMYIADQRFYRLGLVLSVFSGIMSLIIIIGFIVFYGNVNKRQILIKKIQGATTAQIIHEGTIIFCSLIIISLLIALTVSHFLVNKWISQYVVEFQATISDLLIIIVGYLGAILIIIAFQYSRIIRQIQLP